MAELETKLMNVLQGNEVRKFGIIFPTGWKSLYIINFFSVVSLTGLGPLWVVNSK